MESCTGTDCCIKRCVYYTHIVIQYMFHFATEVAVIFGVWSGITGDQIQKIFTNLGKAQACLCLLPWSTPSTMPKHLYCIKLQNQFLLSVSQNVVVYFIFHHTLWVEPALYGSYIHCGSNLQPTVFITDCMTVALVQDRTVQHKLKCVEFVVMFYSHHVV